MRTRFFDFQIYRRRFLLAVILVLIFSILLLVGTMAFFISSWIDNQRQDATKAYEDIVDRVKKEQDDANDQIWQIYSSIPLMEDTTAFFDSTDKMNYIYLRGINSRNSRLQIQSFPHYIYSFISRRDSYVKGAVLHSYGGSDKTLQSDIAGNLNITYAQPGQHLVMDDVWLLGSYEVMLSGKLSQMLGTISFWVDGDEIFSTRHPFIGEYAVIDQRGNIWGSHSSDTRRIQWLKRAYMADNPMGSFLDGGRWVFYYCQEDLVHQFSYVTAVDIGTLLSVNAGLIWMLILAVALLDIIVISFIFWNVHYDSAFLGYLLRLIEKVEKGDFKAVKELERPRFQGKDEYSIISTALENMSYALDEYIRIEYRLKLKQQETDMRAMQHQINPHFLYNTLEAIRAKALLEKNPMTADAIALLGGLYRDMVRKENVLRFAEEKELLETYLKIMQLRYPDSFGYQIVLDSELLDVKTPKFWLQPLAENFFSHGFDRCSEYNILVVTGEAEGNGWRIKVMDNGSGVKDDQLPAINERMKSGDDHSGSSIGLHNVYTRLAYFYGKKFSMEVLNNPEGGACISIYIPNKEASDVYPANS